MRGCSLLTIRSRQICKGEPGHLGALAHLKLIRGGYSRGAGIEAIGIYLRVVASDVSTSTALESNGLMPGVVAAKRATITPDADDKVKILILNVGVKQRARGYGLALSK